MGSISIIRSFKARIMSALRTFTLLFAVLALAAAARFPSPGRGAGDEEETPDGEPTCYVYWVVPESCPNAMDAMATGIKKWTLESGCRVQPPIQQRCEFFMIGGADNGDLSVPMTGEDPNMMTVYHIYMPEVYLEVAHFNFTAMIGNLCFITGESTSQAYADNDVGATYCAMERMMLESGMPDMYGYEEFTADAFCPNYSNSNCFAGNQNRS